MILEYLLKTYPLGPRWNPPQLFQDELIIGEYRLPLAGLKAVDKLGLVITGSAGGPTDGLLPRCYFEMLERTSIVDAEVAGGVAEVKDREGKVTRTIELAQLFPTSPQPDLWKYAKSNGVAAHVEWAKACEAAEAELVERHRLLRSWYGGAAPRKLTIPEGLIPSALKEFYQFEAYALPKADALDWQVVAFFGFPLKAEAPPVHGFGAKRSLSEALEGASRECFQRLGFLWGEAITQDAIAFAPSPAYHQEVFLQPAGTSRLKHWLAGEHVSAALAAPAASSNSTVEFADLSPQHLKGQVVVVKAIAPWLLPLAFGHWSDAAPPSFPKELLVHPIL